MSGQHGGGLRVAVIGLGWAAHHIWLPRLAGHPAFALTAIVDPDPAARARAAALADVPALADAGQLGPDDTDLAVVAVPNHLHAAVASPLLERGVPVFVEKPVCLTAAEVATLSMAERRGRSVLLAGSAARYRSDIMALRDVAGSLGPIRHLELTWIRARGIPRQDGWFTDRSRSGGGAFVDLGWHLLDVAFALVGSIRVGDVLGTVSADFIADPSWQASWRGDVPARLARSADGDVEDTAHVFVVVGNGVGVSLRTSWASHQSCDVTKVTVEGAAGAASLECTFGFSPNRLAQPALTVLCRGEISRVPLEQEPIGTEYERQLDALPALLADPDLRGHALTEAASAVQVIERFYRKARTPTSVSRRTVGPGPGAGVHQNDGAQAIAAPPDVRRLQSELAAAASGDRFVLYARLPVPSSQPADIWQRMLAASRLATLDAVAMLYSSGRSVITLLELDAAGQLSQADRSRHTAALADLILAGQADDHDEVRSAQQRMARLRLPSGSGPGAPEVIAQLGRAVTFMQAWGFDVQTIGQTLRTSTFIVSGSRQSVPAGPRVGAGAPDDNRVASHAHALIVDMRAPSLTVATAAATLNPVVLRIPAGINPDLVTDWCDRLDPRLEPGRLLISIGPAALPAIAQVARELRRSGHFPACVYECPASEPGIDQLRLVSEMLGETKLRLAGICLTIAGRHLQYVARAAQVLADITPTAQAAWLEGAR